MLAIGSLIGTTFAASDREALSSPWRRTARERWNRSEAGLSSRGWDRMDRSVDDEEWGSQSPKFTSEADVSPAKKTQSQSINLSQVYTPAKGKWHEPTLISRCRSCYWNGVVKWTNWSFIFKPCDLVQFSAIWSATFQFLHFSALPIGPSFARSWNFHYCDSVCLYQVLHMTGPAFSSNAIWSIFRSWIFLPCYMVRHFPVLAFSSYAIWSIIFQVLYMTGPAFSTHNYNNFLITRWFFGRRKAAGVIRAGHSC